MSRIMISFLEISYYHLLSLIRPFSLFLQYPGKECRSFENTISGIFLKLRSIQFFHLLFHFAAE